MSYKKYLCSCLNLLILFSFFYCTDKGEITINPPPTKDNGKLEYVTGELLVGFEDTVKYSFASQFLSRFPFEIKQMDFDSSFAIWLQIDQGNPDHFITLFSAYPFIRWIKLKGYPRDDGDPGKKYLLAQYYSTISIDSAKTLINKISGISIKYIIVPSKSAHLGIEIGKEIFWRDSLMSFSFIKYAELNYIFFISESN